MMQDFKAQIPGSVRKVMKRIHQAGYAVFIVGGFVRDVLLKKEAKDIDLVTDASSAQLKALFGKKSRLIGRRFPIVHIDIGRGDVIEVSSLPQLPFTQKLSLTYKRQRIIEQMIAEDCQRRDFTINAMYLTYPNFELIDKLKGSEDIKNRYIRFIGVPRVRLSEDPVRVLRALRFEAKFGFRQNKHFAQWVKHFKKPLKKVSHQRMFLEFIKLMHTGHSQESVRLLNQYGLLDLFIKTKDIKIDYLLDVAAHCDEQYLIGRSQSSSFLMAALMWPLIKQCVGQQDFMNDRKEDLFSYLMRISQHCACLTLPRRLQEFMISIWILCLMIDAKALSDDKVQFLPGASHAQDLLRIWHKHI